MLGDRFASTIDNVENFGEVLAQVPQDLSLFHQVQLLVLYWRLLRPQPLATAALAPFSPLFSSNTPLKVFYTLLG